MTQKESTILGLIFRMDQEGKVLLAEFTPVEQKQLISYEEIRRALKLQQLDAVSLDPDALDDLILSYGKSTEPFSLIIGKCEDAAVEISVEADKMTAYLTIIPPRAGQAVKRKQVEDALQQAGIKVGLLDAEIDVAVAAGAVDGVLIAKGTEAINGLDAQFVSLVPEIGENGLKVDERGTVDYRELGLFITVKVDDPLMKRIPATLGTPGKNIFGETVPAKSGKDYRFAKGLKGAKYAPRNYDLLLAEIAGQAILVTRGVKVEPTLSVKGVDLSTGNLDFEGSVNISKDVKSGMRIKVSGDLIIGGTVEAAEIHADGNISIRGGIIGHGERTTDNHARQDTAHISCGGVLSALFVENARIEAGDSIIIAEVAKQSELIATHHIVIGRDGSRKGHIVGGSARATQLIKAAVVGSPAGLHTEIQTGLNPALQGSINALELKLEKLYKERDELQRAIGYASENQERVRADLLLKVENTLQKLALDILEYEEEKFALETKSKLTENAKVIISRQIFGGVMLRIGHNTLQIKFDKEGGTYHLLDGEIVLDPS